ncbi:autotransporter outer membrane beta-barrel domain-containing protein, partial [Helicobacter sp. 13S00477-4]|uniref:autotransporter outer membrane beta-barrel domain-containing protein n=1 Tax=Helicobacter sp. 13S00477-4 TaxID=1905759 RepID=UPI0011799438
YRLISPTPFASRTLNVNTINGNNGVFRLMADVDRGLIDTIRATNVNGKEYIQIYQNPNKISIDTAGKNMVVAHATNVADSAGFEGIATIIGLYDYLPILEQRTAAGGGTDWILSAIEANPNQTAKSLFNILSLPYQIYRLQSDNLHSRVEDLLYPPTLNGAWLKISGGGIYTKQPFSTPTTQNLFYHLSGGYDWGKNFENERYFYGISLDYTKLYVSDKGFEGNDNAFGIGGYVGYIHQDGWVLDGGLQYVFNPIKANLYQASKPIEFNNHLFILSGRVGYNIYPISKTRQRVIEQCVQKVFCRNGISNVQVRDDTLYFQPFVSMNTGYIPSNHFSFTEQQSLSNVKAKIDGTMAFIAKIGLLGVKRFDYMTSALNLKGLVDYSFDLNTGGKMSLIDDTLLPLYNKQNQKPDHRLGFGIGGEWLFLDDSLKLYADFKTEFFGRIDTYWLVSAGIRYKFGQTPQKLPSQINYRPKPMQTQKNKPSRSESYFKPYQTQPKRDEGSFYQKNHFKYKEEKTNQRPKIKTQPPRINRTPSSSNRVWQSVRPGV